MISEFDQSVQPHDRRTVVEVDQSLVIRMQEFLETVVGQFVEDEPRTFIYGFAVEVARDFKLSVYFNSPEGYESLPNQLREESPRFYEPLSDDEIRAHVGKWFLEQWEYDLYEYNTSKEVRALNKETSETFAEKSDKDKAYQEYHQTVQQAFDLVLRSQIFESLSKTSDFEARLVKEDDPTQATGGSNLFGE